MDERITDAAMILANANFYMACIMKNLNYSSQAKLTDDEIGIIHAVAVHCRLTLDEMNKELIKRHG